MSQQQPPAKQPKWMKYVRFDPIKQTSLLHTLSEKGGEKFDQMYNVLEAAAHEGIDLEEYLWKRDHHKRLAVDYIFLRASFFDLDNFTRILQSPMPSFYDDILTPQYVAHRDQEQLMVKGYIEAEAAAEGATDVIVRSEGVAEAKVDSESDEDTDEECDWPQPKSKRCRQDNENDDDETVVDA